MTFTMTRVTRPASRSTYDTICDEVATLPAHQALRVTLPGNCAALKGALYGRFRSTHHLHIRKDRDGWIIWLEPKRKGGRTV